jgi:hypothetical protein
MTYKLQLRMSTSLRLQHVNVVSITSFTIQIFSFIIWIRIQNKNHYITVKAGQLISNCRCNVLTLFLWKRNAKSDLSNITFTISVRMK